MKQLLLIGTAAAAVVMSVVMALAWIAGKFALACRWVDDQITIILDRVL